MFVAFQIDQLDEEPFAVGEGEIAVGAAPADSPINPYAAEDAAAQYPTSAQQADELPSFQGDPSLAAGEPAQLDESAAVTPKAVIAARRPTAKKPLAAAGAPHTFFPMSFGQSHGASIAVANAHSTGQGDAMSHAVAYANKAKKQ